MTTVVDQSDNPNNSTGVNHTTTPEIEEHPHDAVNCQLVGFLPFTNNGNEFSYYGLGDPTFWQATHVAAALIATDHLNSHSNDVVPNLSAMMENCSHIHFPDPIFGNTDNSATDVSKFMVDNAYNGVKWCGIVGPWSSIPAEEASNFATGLGIPLISHADSSTQLTNLFLNPANARTTVNLHPISEAIINWFRTNGRIDFLGMIAVTATYGDQFMEGMDNAAKESGFRHLSRYTIAPPWDGYEPNRGIGAAVAGIKNNGYRSIFVVLNNIENQLQLLADYAELYGMNNGDHVWMIASNVDMAAFSRAASNNTNVTKLMKGSATLRVLDGFVYNTAMSRNDLFLQHWKQGNESLVERLNSAFPIKRGTGSFKARPSYFETHKPEDGAGYMYDAVISQGIGKCKEWNTAQQQKQEQLRGRELTQENRGEEEEEETYVLGGVTTASAGGREQKTSEGARSIGNSNVDSSGHRRTRGVRGVRSPQNGHLDVSRQLMGSKKTASISPHLKGVVSSEFDGATGHVVFGENLPVHTGSRRRESVTYGIYNYRDVESVEKQADPSLTTWHYLTHILQGHPTNATWTPTPFAPFLFASTSPDPPKTLRDMTEQNFISRGVQIVGWSFFGLVFSMVLSALLFVHLFRKEETIRQSQPTFLYLLMIGCALMSIGMITLSFDENNGLTHPQLDTLCITTPWFVVLGYIIMYSALFSKLRRINKVLQFARRKVEVRHVVGPFIAIIILTIAVLAVWTIIDPFRWHRREINENTGESYGRCNSESNVYIYLIATAILMCITTLATGLMAWKTKDIDERFSEAKWIFYTIFVQVQLLILGIPMQVILRTSSAEATYLGRALLLFLVVFTSLLLMIGPKLVVVLSKLRLKRHQHRQRKERAAGPPPSPLGTDMARSVPQSSTQKRIKRGGSSGVGSVRVTGMEESYHRLVTINNNNPLVSAAPEEQGNSRSEVDMFNCSQESLLTKSNSRDGSGSLLTSLHTLGEERISTKTFDQEEGSLIKNENTSRKGNKEKEETGHPRA